MSYAFHFDVFKYIIDVMFLYLQRKKMLTNFLGYDFYPSFTFISTFIFKPFKNLAKIYLENINLGHSPRILILSESGWGKSRFTVVSSQNTEFILVLLSINYYVPYEQL